jgi:hypothetical protein
LQTQGIFFQRKGLRLAPLFPPFVPKCPSDRKNEHRTNISPPVLQSHGDGGRRPPPSQLCW